MLNTLITALCALSLDSWLLNQVVSVVHHPQVEGNLHSGLTSVGSAPYCWHGMAWSARSLRRTMATITIFSTNIADTVRVPFSSYTCDDRQGCGISYSQPLFVVALSCRRLWRRSHCCLLSIESSSRSEKGRGDQ